jgi:hypothetical protein
MSFYVLGFEPVSTIAASRPRSTRLSQGEGTDSGDRSRSPLFFQHHLVAAPVKLDMGHEHSHEHHASPARVAERTPPIGLLIVSGMRLDDGARR